MKDFLEVILEDEVLAEFNEIIFGNNPNKYIGYFNNSALALTLGYNQKQIAVVSYISNLINRLITDTNFFNQVARGTINNSLKEPWLVYSPDQQGLQYVADRALSQLDRQILDAQFSGNTALQAELIAKKQQITARAFKRTTDRSTLAWESDGFRVNDTIVYPGRLERRRMTPKRIYEVRARKIPSSTGQRISNVQQPLRVKYIDPYLYKNSTLLRDIRFTIINLPEKGSVTTRTNLLLSDLTERFRARYENLLLATPEEQQEFSATRAFEVTTVRYGEKVPRGYKPIWATLFYYELDTNYADELDAFRKKISTAEYRLLLELSINQKYIQSGGLYTYYGPVGYSELMSFTFN